MGQSNKELQVIEISSRAGRDSTQGQNVQRRHAAQRQVAQSGVGQAQNVQRKYTLQAPGGLTAQSKVQQSRHRKKKRRLHSFFRLLFLTVGLLLLVYVVVVGAFLYQQEQPKQVDFEDLRRELIAAAGTQDADDLTEEMLKLYERNAEAEDFVKNYVNRQEYLGKDIDLAEDVQEGQVPLLMQWDKRWGYESFGDSNIGLAGCGPTCLSMAYLYFTGDLQGNPREIAAYCEKGGFYTSEGTSWDFWTLGAVAFGLSGEVLPLDKHRMQNALDNGSLIICSMRPGDFTETGHYILLRGYDENGFYVNDPNSRSNSEKKWSYETIDGQIKNLWKIDLNN